MAQNMCFLFCWIYIIFNFSWKQSRWTVKWSEYPLYKNVVGKRNST